MIDPGMPKFQWGQPVQPIDDLFNDGSYPNLPGRRAVGKPPAIAARSCRSAAHVESNTTIYLVEFSENRIVGCLEDEIMAVSSAQPAVANESQAP